MVKLSDALIEQKDIQEYLEKCSDFAFEIRVMNELARIGFECEHGGTYTDPISQKTRQFDIKARRFQLSPWGNMNGSSFLRHSMAVECKNLRRNFPLVVQSLPRDDKEAYQDIVLNKKDRNLLPSHYKAVTKRLIGQNSIYRYGELVGKSCDQIGRKYSNSKQEKGEITSLDSKVFDKISQAINTSYDMICECYEENNLKGELTISSVIPVLVIPDNCLWVITYDNSGEVTQEPQKANRAALYIGKSYNIPVKRDNDSREFTLSHLEVIEISYLEKCITELFNNDFELV